MEGQGRGRKTGLMCMSMLVLMTGHVWAVPGPGAEYTMDWYLPFCEYSAEMRKCLDVGQGDSQSSTCTEAYSRGGSWG